MRLVTDIELDEVEKLETGVKNGGNPKEAKMRLAREVVSMLHSDEDAKTAEANFESQFSDGQLPEEIDEVEVETGTRSVGDILTELKLVESKSEARRMLEQGGVKLNQEKVTEHEITISSGDVVQVGKRKFARIK